MKLELKSYYYRCPVFDYLNPIRNILEVGWFLELYGNLPFFNFLFFSSDFNELTNVCLQNAKEQICQSSDVITCQSVLLQDLIVVCKMICH